MGAGALPPSADRRTVTCPRGQPRAFGPLRAGRPRSQGGAPIRWTWERGQLARSNTPVGLRPTCGRDARAPRGLRYAGPGSAGSLPARTHRWAFGPLAGGTPALPGGSDTLDLGARAACSLEHTGGPSAHLRAGRPRSQGRSDTLDLGARAACPLEHTGGPSAHVRAGRPRSQRAPIRWTWERGQLARLNTPVGLRPTCGRDARAPRSSSRHAWLQSGAGDFSPPSSSFGSARHSLKMRTSQRRQMLRSRRPNTSPIASAFERKKFSSPISSR